MTETRLVLVNPPMVKKMAGTKATRSASAKKAAATRKRNAAKRSAAAKKAAATRKRNGRKAPAKRSTAAKRSSSAKKAAATRKRNAAKRSTSAKKAAATRKRNGRKAPAKRTARKSPAKRSTAAKRSSSAKKAAATRKRNAAKRSTSAKKAAATRKRNGRKAPAKRTARKSPVRMTKAKRSAAAKKAWRTRRRNGTASRKGTRKGSRKGSRKAKTSKAFVSKAGKNTYAAAMNAVNALPGYALMGVYGAIAVGSYNLLKTTTWDMIGVEGYVDSASAKIGEMTTANIGSDLGNFANKAIAVGTIAALGHLLSSKKALGLIDAKLTNSTVGIAGLFYGVKFLSEMSVLNIGSVVTNLAMGDLSGAKNAFGNGTTGLYGTLGMSGQSPWNKPVNALPMFGTASLGMAQNNLLNQMGSNETSAIQTGGGNTNTGFFGTGKSLGSTRVNLF